MVVLLLVVVLLVTIGGRRVRVGVGEGTADEDSNQPLTPKPCGESLNNQNQVVSTCTILARAIGGLYRFMVEGLGSKLLKAGLYGL